MRVQYFLNHDTPHVNANCLFKIILQVVTHCDIRFWKGGRVELKALIYFLNKFNDIELGDSLVF